MRTDAHNAADVALTGAERMLIERFGLDFERAGATRSLGRLFGYLLLREEPVTAARVTRDLGLSKAMTSVTLRQAVDVGMAQVMPVPGARRRHLAMTPGWGVTMTIRKLRLLSAWRDLGREGLLALGAAGTSRQMARARLDDLVEFFDYLEERFSAIDEDFARFRSQRAERGTQGASHA